MKLEHQVCTLEQAKRLKKLEVKAESAFIWTLTSMASNHDDFMLAFSFPANPDTTRIPFYPAYSCAELGVMLPSKITMPFIYLYPGQELYYASTQDDDNNFHCGYSIQEWTREQDMDFEYMAISEAQAKAGLLIHLLERKIIKPEELWL